MKAMYILLTTVFFLTGCSDESDDKNTDGETSNDTVVETYQEPRHKLVFEDADLKILDVQIKPEDTTLFHRHKTPVFFVSLGWQKSAEQLLNEGWKDLTPDGLSAGKTILNTSYLEENIIHRVTNVGTKLSRLIGVLNTGSGLKSDALSSTDETANRWFRSKQVELDKDEKLEFKQLEFPTVIVIVSGDAIEVTNGDKSRILNEKWLKVQDMNQLKNMSDETAILFQIEILK